ncbi:MAG: restriction endonuclease subunit S [Acidimicrobiia bacterium]|nr:restriction endonuclease subunit S [Acidimicrobiia bacterium]
MSAAVPLKRIARITYGLGQPPPLTDSGVPILRATNIERGRIVSKDLIFAAAEDLPLQRTPLLDAGEVLVVRSGAYTGDSALVTEQWAGSAPGYDLRLTPMSAIKPRFLAYSLLGQVAAHSIAVAKNRAAQPHLNAEDLGMVPIVLHRLEEQQRIADYPDAETSRIDELIAEQRHQSVLLGERLTALVDDVFASGVSWRLKHLLAAPLAYGAAEPGMSAEGGWPRYIRTTDMTPEGGLRSDTFRSLAPEVAQPYILRDGDLLLTRSGATVGKAFLYRDSDGPACFAGYLICVRTDRRRVLPEYMMHFTRSKYYWDQVREASFQATIENVSASRYAEFRVPLLPLDAQAAAVERLNAGVHQCRNLQRALDDQISLLQEHRQALITHAVTHGIDGLPGVA